MRIGLLGGSFNPPHAAHRLISLTALKRLRLAQVWWIVTPGNPLKDHAELAPLAERVAACRKVANDARIKVTAFEAHLSSAYTAATLFYLKRRFPEACFVWLMGADNLASFHKWNEWRNIFGMMPVAIVDRPGWRYRALSSKAALAFAKVRASEDVAAGLPCARLPAWCFLSGPLSPLSSTALRHAHEPHRSSLSSPGLTG